MFEGFSEREQQNLKNNQVLKIKNILKKLHLLQHVHHGIYHNGIL